MNCGNRDEVQRRIVDLEDLRQSRRAAFDHAILAADTTASTPRPTSKRAERLLDF